MHGQTVLQDPAPMCFPHYSVSRGPYEQQGETTATYTATKWTL